MKKITSSLFVVFLVSFVTLIFISCADNGNDLPETPPLPKITRLSTETGRIGTPLTIYGNNFIYVPNAEPGMTYRLEPNNSIIKFNGALATAGESVHQDALGMQSMDTYVPEGATSGKVTIMVKNITVSSPNDFIVSDPIYEPPVVTGFGPNSGIIGSDVTIYGNNFVPPVPPPPSRRSLPNTSIVKFNGIIAIAPLVYQDSVGKQSMSSTVPEGATTGKITVTANGLTAVSPNDLMVTTPIYLPNVTVSTVSNSYGIDIDIDNDGNFYLADNDYHKIVKITPDGTMTTLLSTGRLLGIAVDDDGNVYATVGNAIKKIFPDGTVINLAGSPSNDYGYADGQGSAALFQIPFGIDVDVSGNVYVADLFNNKIRKITPDGTVTTLAGSTRGSVDGPAYIAQFDVPIGVAVDSFGNVFVAEQHKIRKITPYGNVTTVAGSTAGYYDAPPAEAQFKGPRSIEVDPLGNLYITDTGNYVVRRISPDGMVVTVAGSTFGSVDGPGDTAKFCNPKGITMDASGALYITQGGGCGKIRKIVIN